MKKENLFWGLLLIASAVFILVAKLGMFPDASALKIFLTILLGVAFVSSLMKMAFWGIFFSAAFLGILYDAELGITAITPWTILMVAFLLSFGMSLLFGPARRKKFASDMSHTHYHVEEGDFVVYDEEDGNRFDFSSSFAGSIKYVNSDNFEAANIEARFAGMKVYFDNAVIQKGQAVINLSVSFAGVELYVPKNWHVDNRMQATFGGVEEKNKSVAADGPTLILQGNVNLGGVTILYI